MNDSTTNSTTDVDINTGKPTDDQNTYENRDEDKPAPLDPGKLDPPVMTEIDYDEADMEQNKE